MTINSKVAPFILWSFVAQILSLIRCRGIEDMGMSKRWIEAEFEAIFREHYERLVRVVRQVLHGDAEAEEVCAEVFLRLYRTGPGVMDGGLVGGWLYRTATRASIDVLRAHKRRGLEEELDADRYGGSEDLDDGPLTRLLRGERIVEVRSVLARLRLKKAQVLLLRHSGLSYQEIADAMQVSAASVGTMLARAEAEFSALYQQQQSTSRKTSRLEAAKEGR
ncbi:MAG TPA: sigma-70 family RNA polymerase sigma factor [Edaphobacter sp.]|nr:sigma-70 family RNA polymerase sigma factor [Edaphobacter sp.]